MKGSKVRKQVISRRSPSQKRAKDLVSAILDASARILEEGEQAKLSTNYIAKKAGVSIGSLYQYFSSKEDVLKSLIESRLENDKSFIRRELKLKAESSLEETLKEIINSFVLMALEQPRLRYTILFYSKTLNLHEQHLQHKIELSGEIATFLQSSFSEEVVTGKIENKILIVLEAIESNIYNNFLTTMDSTIKQKELVSELSLMTCSYLTQRPQVH